MKSKKLGYLHHSDSCVTPVVTVVTGHRTAAPGHKHWPVSNARLLQHIGERCAKDVAKAPYTACDPALDGLEDKNQSCSQTQLR